MDRYKGSAEYDLRDLQVATFVHWLSLCKFGRVGGLS